MVRHAHAGGAHVLQLADPVAQLRARGGGGEPREVDEDLHGAAGPRSPGHAPERVPEGVPGCVSEAAGLAWAGTASGRLMSSGRDAAGRIAARRPVGRRPVVMSFFARL